MTATLVVGQLVGGAGAMAHTLRPFVWVDGLVPTAIVAGAFGGIPGCKDLAVAGTTSGLGRLRILEGSGACTTSFNHVATYSFSGAPTAMALVALNSDPNLDLVVTTKDDKVWVLYGQSGLATFTPGPTISLPAGSEPQAVVAGDWDQTGLTELAVANGGNDTVTILGSAPNFTPTYTYGSGGVAANGVAVGLFDNDMDLDLAVSNYSGDVGILLGTSGTSFNPGASYPAGPLPVGIKAAKFDGDPFVDIVVSSASTIPTVSFLAGDGNGGFQPPVFSSAAGPGPGYQVKSVGVAQLGFGSAALDLAVVLRKTTPPFTSYVRELGGGAGNGTGLFTLQHLTLVADIAGPMAVGPLIAGGGDDFAVGSTNLVSILDFF